MRFLVNILLSKKSVDKYMLKLRVTFVPSFLFSHLIKTEVHSTPEAFFSISAYKIKRSRSSVVTHQFVLAIYTYPPLVCLHKTDLRDACVENDAFRLSTPHLREIDQTKMKVIENMVEMRIFVIEIFRRI